MLRDVEKRVNALGVKIKFTDEAVAALAKEGFDPVYGARPLRSAIVRKVEDRFSEEMLSGNVAEGDTVLADYADGSVVFKKEHSEN